MAFPTFLSTLDLAKNCGSVLPMGAAKAHAVRTLVMRSTFAQPRSPLAEERGSPFVEPVAPGF